MMKLCDKIKNDLAKAGEALCVCNEKMTVLKVLSEFAAVEGLPESEDLVVHGGIGRILDEIIEQTCEVQKLIDGAKDCLGGISESEAKRVSA
jgi:hypothetical protein